jgi:indole-3-glycerol phosphate synthase
MQDFLSEIIELKQKRLDEAKVFTSFEALRERALIQRQSAKKRALRESLNNGSRLNVIAEFKRASPSKGLIRDDVGPEEIARFYEAGGAAAMSVLTEEDRFRGSLDDLRRVRATISLPVLRKDFLFDEFQLYETAVAGADALLLIVAMLNDETLARLRHIAEEELEMDALVEVHNKEELTRAIQTGATLIGVNNRDLRSFNVSLDVSIELIRYAPKNVLMIAESGLNSREDLVHLSERGYKGFLIGESLMRAEKPDEALRKMVFGLGA